MIRFSKIGRSVFSRAAFPTALMLCASLSMPAMADNVCQLLVKMKNDEQKAFILEEKPVVTFNATQCVIECKDFTGYYEMSEVADITFVDNLGGVSEAVKDLVALKFTDPVTAVVSGVPVGVEVSLYTLDGIRLQSVKADEEGVAILDMSQISSGSVCVISVNAIKNFKLQKK